MADEQFDDLLQRLTSAPSRQDAVAALVAGALLSADLASVAEGSTAGVTTTASELNMARSSSVSISLDALGVFFESSLSSRERDLLSPWEERLFPRQTRDLEILQIGVGNGGSLRTWATWFPDSRVTGLDVRRIRLRDLPTNVDVIQGDQTDTMFLSGLCQSRTFDLVFDDGSDDAEDKIHTFLTAFPWLAPGALFISVNPDSREVFDKDGGWRQLEDVPTTSLGRWFGHLSSALVSGARAEYPLRTPVQMVLHRLRSVTSFPGSVIVQAKS